MIVTIDVISPFTQGNPLTGWEEQAAGIAVANITEMAFHEWRNIAQRRLKSTMGTYLSQMVISHPRSGVGEITLSGWLPMAVEFGQPLRDLKEVMLSGGKAPKIAHTKKGPVRFKRVPFRHAMMQETYHVAPLPPPVADALRKSRGGTGPISLKNVYKSINRHTGYESAVGMYHNVARNAPATGIGPVGRPMTFRTISDNSHGLAWFQRIEARNFREDVIRFIQREAPAIMRAIFA